MAGVLEQLRRAIEASGTTRYAIGKATGIDQAQLSKLMKGQAGLSVENVEKLAVFLELEIIIRPRRKKKGR